MNVLDYMKDHILFLDGGMGTLLQAEGLGAGEYPERWNISRPEVVKKIHQAYYDAGSNVVNTNTFGANSLKFGDEELEQIIRCAVENARAAREDSTSSGEKFIALDIGPTGKLLKPYGDLDFEDAVSVFAKTVRIGAACGVDLVFIETMNDSYETKAALLAAKENCSLPVFVSNAYGENGMLMTGASPEAMCAMLEGMGADVIGLNCSLGPQQLRPVALEYLRCSSIPVLFKPNAGLPRRENGRTVYDVSAEVFAAEVESLLRAGIRAAGGCCGTTPEYIRKLTELAGNLEPVPVTEKKVSRVSSYTHAVSFGKEPVLIGERINPTGKKRFKQALRENDIDYILDEGFAQQDEGVQILDVNVGLPEIDEPSMLESVVCELQTVLDLPLQIDTSDPEAMERALRRYNGKAMINSVNGKQESIQAVFPLVRKYGGLVVALTLDEGGIPAKAQGRVDIAKKIMAAAKEYGISEKDLIFDPLAMAVSADQNAAMVTLETVRRIREELGANTILGVSNVSFGLPVRDYITSGFFMAALENGLSAAIMNPHSFEMQKTYRTYRVLHGLDDNCAGYISFAEKVPFEQNPASAGRPAGGSPGTADTEKGISRLQSAITKGLKDQAAQVTGELLKEKEPLQIVSEEIIPALDIAGKGFEAKTVYLPQLLMSAEAAKAAFETIKSVMAGNPDNTSGIRKCPFVLATVQGDIHDIGKNIVKLLLENYGFDVRDLGKDVAPEKIVEKVIELHAPLAGLSALMTTTVGAMEKTVKELKEQAPWCRIVVGGAVLTEEYAREIGADRYASDAMETVRYAEEIYAGLEDRPESRS